jgi:hypothetical protein
MGRQHRSGITAVMVVLAIVGGSRQAEAQERAPSMPVAPVEVPQSRPQPLIPLYSTMAAMQGADMLLTIQGQDRGLHEQNPLMRGNSAAMIATKAVATATTIVLLEQMWKRNRTAAVAIAVAANAVTMAVVARNAHLVRQTTR